MPVELRGFEPLTPSEGRPYATPRRTSGGSWPNPLDLKHCRGSNHFVDPTLPDNLVASRRLSEVLSADFVVSHSAVHLGRRWGCHVNHGTPASAPIRSGTREAPVRARRSPGRVPVHPHRCTAMPISVGKSSSPCQRRSSPLAPLARPGYPNPGKPRRTPVDRRRGPRRDAGSGRGVAHPASDQVEDQASCSALLHDCSARSASFRARRVDRRPYWRWPTPDRG
jgi:hypothetical protein